MAKLDLANIIRVVLLAALTGLADVNTSALALITSDVPIPTNYGTYGIYLNSNGVASDFGSSSSTYELAEYVFAQSPNILSGGGYLVVIPRLATAPAAPATIVGTAPVDLTALTGTNYYLHAGATGLKAPDAEIGAINSSSLAAAQASLNSAAITSAGFAFTLSGQVTAATITLTTIATGATAEITVGTAATGTDIAALLNISGAVAAGADAGVERVKDCILRTQGSVNYFGIILNDTETTASLTELAALMQTMDKILVVGSSAVTDISGVFTTIMENGDTHTRCLFHSESPADALYFAAAYASRGFSIDFSGSNTAHTMHLKDLANLDTDEGLTQTLLTQCQNAGVDFYGDFGVAKVFTSGANLFFDQIYTQLAFKLKLRVAGFNYLAQTDTKIPQTEEGMNGLKGALRQVCKAFVTNGVFAPGTWTSSVSFGTPEDTIRNIAQSGYYIYSDPISGQSEAERTARVAPRIYIAAKDAGAIHSSDVTVYVEN
jgi:hypothetical protein